MHSQIEYSTLINTTPEIIWDYLTQPQLMKQWIGEPEMDIEIHTNWEVNSTILISGFHHIRFENKGIVLEYSPYTTLTYTHLDSISRLADVAENYSIISFQLRPDAAGTMLTVNIHNFPTESIFKHLDFYWRGTVGVIRDLVEKK